MRIIGIMPVVHGAAVWSEVLRNYLYDKKKNIKQLA
jgi:hypothetical protein